MTISAIIHQIVSDRMFATMLAAVTIDLVLGVIAAVARPTVAGPFRLSYLTNFMRNDVLGKVVPWALLEAGAIVAGDFSIVIPGLDMSAIATTAGAGIVAAMVGSIIASLADLGFPAPAALRSARGLGG